MNTKTFFALFLFSIIVFSTTNAQVTIGSANAPSSGSIIQLKQDENLTNNSTKGLGLPRVALTDKNNLYPMFAGNTDYENNTDDKKTNEDLAHEGLIVYNVTTDICKNLYAGVQIWDGKTWNPLGTGHPSETDVLIDTRDPAKPAKYAIGRFVGKNGEDAGWWMLENLRAEIWPDGNTTEFGLSLSEPTLRYESDGTTPNPSHADAHFYYPSLDGNTFTNSSAQGYMYNFQAAARTAKEHLEASEDTKGQGICPNNWHLPTSQEWNALQNAVRENPCPYSYATEPATSNATIGNWFISETEPKGLSRPIKDGGFNATTLGIIARNQTSGALQIDRVGSWAAYWVSNGYQPIPNNTKRAPYAVFLVDSGAGFYTSGYGWVPIRCKKD